MADVQIVVNEENFRFSCRVFDDKGDPKASIQLTRPDEDVQIDGLAEDQASAIARAIDKALRQHKGK